MRLWTICDVCLQGCVYCIAFFPLLSTDILLLECLFLNVHLFCAFCKQSSAPQSAERTVFAPSSHGSLGMWPGSALLCMAVVLNVIDLLWIQTVLQKCPPPPSFFTSKIPCKKTNPLINVSVVEVVSSVCFVSFFFFVLVLQGCSSPLVVKFADTQRDKEQRRLQQQLVQQIQQLNNASTWGNLAGLGTLTPQYLAVSIAQMDCVITPVSPCGSQPLSINHVQVWKT